MRHPVLDSTRVYWTSNFMRDAARAFTIFKASFDPHSSPLALPCYLRFLESTRLMLKSIFWQITQKFDSALNIFSLFLMHILLWSVEYMNKGGLISESFSLWLKSPKEKKQKHCENGKKNFGLGQMSWS